MNIRIFILILFVATGLPAQKGLLFTSKIDTQEILIGDHIQLHFDWTSPIPLEKIQIRTEAWDSIASLEWVKEEPLIHEERSDVHFYRKEYRFTFFDSGAYRLPPIPVQWAKENQTEYSESRVFEVIVQYPELDENQLAPIKPIEEEPLHWSDIDQYVYLSLLAILFVAAFLYWRSRPKPKEQQQEEKPDPNEEAFQQLQALESKKYLEDEKYELFQVELTHIMRSFLSKRYAVKAMESTTREILNDMRRTDFPEYKKPVLKELLTMADLVKFAQAEKEADFHKRMLLEAKEIVKQTSL